MALLFEFLSDPGSFHFVALVSLGCCSRIQVGSAAVCISARMNTERRREKSIGWNRLENISGLFLFVWYVFLWVTRGFVSCFSHSGIQDDGPASSEA